MINLKEKMVIIDVIAYAFVALFVYTALSKWLLYDVYLYDLKRSPELGYFATPISIIIPGSELIVSTLLLFGKTKRVGMFGALLLMVAFTLYVAYVIVFTGSRPCTCGGIIRDLTWPQHLVFNIVFTSLAVVALVLGKKKNVPPDTTTQKRILTPA